MESHQPPENNGLDRNAKGLANPLISPMDLHKTKRCLILLEVFYRLSSTKVPFSFLLELRQIEVNTKLS
ncbi:hypothetical protein CO026_03195 [Candidatus Kaiserbacteria bacterium CG_4_9_14_0_2_um_filter_41_32]|uniref:Uncharacterized protein n=1 Tax=Candidatus Kaiserbacteria bacterium CG_4_9_14_0_2_um_filter_41_32 TaxID=1974601 RepID=A0A2M8FE48_9BACT|nr:MAG: hypothetical protein CO026_03195 [Candidatus Kaiserbacteria bacterium CG_4_9_14_0_2_um_filter_41_32]